MLVDDEIEDTEVEDEEDADVIVVEDDAVEEVVLLVDDLEEFDVAVLVDDDWFEDDIIDVIGARRTRKSTAVDAAIKITTIMIMAAVTLLIEAFEDFRKNFQLLLI